MKMKNNSGFTLVELLAVMVLLGFVMTLALPIYSSVYNTIKNTTYINTIKTIRMAALDYSANSYVKDEVKNSYHVTGSNDWCKTVNVGDLIKAGYLKSDNDYNDQITDLYTGLPLGYNSLHNDIYEESTMSLCYCMNSLSVEAYLTKDLAPGQFYHKGETVRFFETSGYYKFRIVSNDFSYDELLGAVIKALKKGEYSVTYEGESFDLSSFSSITDYSTENTTFITTFNALIKLKYLSKEAACNH